MGSEHDPTSDSFEDLAHPCRHWAWLPQPRAEALDSKSMQSPHWLGFRVTVHGRLGWLD